MEKIVVVDKEGVIKKFSTKSNLSKKDIVAVELVITYLPESKRVVLFNRGESASDMHDRWSLESGKVILEDLSPIDAVGQKLSVQAYKNAAVRELMEELNYLVEAQALQRVDEFYMGEKHIYFTLLSLAIQTDDLRKLTPNQSELDQFKLFSLREFDENTELGDAIVHRKDQIRMYLQNVFEKSI